MKIYAGNLVADVTEEELQELFKQFGKVTSATLVKDKDDDTLKGFAYIEMRSKSDANAAITGLNGVDFKGNSLVVNKARLAKGTAGSGSGASQNAFGSQGRYRGNAAGGKKGGRSGGAAGGARPNRSGQRGS